MSRNDSVPRDVIRKLALRIRNRVNYEINLLNEYYKDWYFPQINPHETYKVRKKDGIYYKMGLVDDPELKLTRVVVYSLKEKPSGLLNIRNDFRYEIKEVFEQHSIDRFVEVFTHSPEFKDCITALAAYFARDDFNRFPHHMYLTVFCHRLVSDMLSNYLKSSANLTDDEIDTRITRFLKDVEEKTFALVIRLGLFGIEVSGAFNLSLENKQITLRKHDRSDVRSHTVRMYYGDIVDDVFRIPEIVVPTSVLEIKYRGLALHDSFSINPIKFYHTISIIDTIYAIVRGDLNTANVILNLFQSQVHSKWTHIDFDVYLKNMVPGGPAFTFRRTFTAQQPSNSFIIDSSNSGRLQMFWEKMIQADFWDRILSPISRDDKSPRYSGPTSYAFYKYNSILENWKRDDSVIYDIVHTLESLYTPQVRNRLLNARMRKLFMLIGLKLDESALDRAYKIRSEYSHYGPGWDDKYDYWKEDLVKLLLFYLKVSVICRLLLFNWQDKEFLKMIDTEYRNNEVKKVFAGLKHIVISEKVPKHPGHYWWTDWEEYRKRMGIRKAGEESE